MDIPFASWASPVGNGIFLASLGIFFWGFFSGLAALNKTKDAKDSTEAKRLKNS